MKKLSRILLLCALLALLLCGTALAEGTEPRPAGFYNIPQEDELPSNVTVTPQTAAGETVTASQVDVDGTEGTETFYAGAEKLSVTVSGAAVDTQCAIFLVTGDLGTTGLPTEANTICYIDQKEADGSVTFTVYPNLEGVRLGAMTLLITGDNGFETRRVTLYYAPVPYTLGDVDNDGAIDTSDALLALRIYVGTYTPTDTEWLAADVTRDSENVVDTSDALMILRYYVGNITSFD